MPAAPITMKMQLVRGLTRMNADPDNPRESAFIRVPFSHQATCLPAPITMKMQLVRGLTRMNADPDNPRESAFIRVPYQAWLGSYEKSRPGLEGFEIERI
jgi:hypothetical protein